MLEKYSNPTEKVDIPADVVADAAQKVKQALKDLPGAAIDKADGDRTTRRLVDQRTCEQNNNPLNNEGPSDKS